MASIDMKNTAAGTLADEAHEDTPSGPSPICQGLTGLVLSLAYLAILTVLGVVMALKGASVAAVAVPYAFGIFVVPVLLKILQMRFVPSSDVYFHLLATVPWIVIFISIAVGFAVPHYKQTQFPELTLQQPNSQSERLAMSEARSKFDGFTFTLNEGVVANASLGVTRALGADADSSSFKWCCIAPVISSEEDPALESRVLVVDCDDRCENEREALLSPTMRVGMNDKWLDDSERDELLTFMNATFKAEEAEFLWLGDAQEKQDLRERVIRAMIITAVVGTLFTNAIAFHCAHS